MQNKRPDYYNLHVSQFRKLQFRLAICTLVFSFRALREPLVAVVRINKLYRLDAPKQGLAAGIKRRPVQGDRMRVSG
jgi:hypothetical protein